MAMTIRLTAKSRKALDALSRRLRQSRSQVVREAIEQYAAEPGPAARQGPYEDWADIIGVVDLSKAAGGDARAGTTGEGYTALVRAKARARRTR